MYLFIEGNNTRHLHHHVEWYKLKHRETKHGYSFVFQECIQVLFLALEILRMVRSLRLMYKPKPPKKLCSSSTSKPPSKSGFFKLCKKGGRCLQRTGGAGITKPFTNWKKETQKIKSHSTFYPVKWTWKLIDLEKKDPLSASFKMLKSSKDYKIGRQLKL